MDTYKLTAVFLGCLAGSLMGKLIARWLDERMDGRWRKTE